MRCNWIYWVTTQTKHNKKRKCNLSNRITLYIDTTERQVFINSRRRMCPILFCTKACTLKIMIICITITWKRLLTYNVYMYEDILKCWQWKPKPNTTKISISLWSSSKKELQKSIWSITYFFFFFFFLTTFFSCSFFSRASLVGGGGGTSSSPSPSPSSSIAVLPIPVSARNT